MNCNPIAVAFKFTLINHFGDYVIKFQSLGLMNIIEYFRIGYQFMTNFHQFSTNKYFRDFVHSISLSWSWKKIEGLDNKYLP